MVLEVTSQDGRTLIVGNDLSWFYSPPPTSNHHLTNLLQDLVFIAGKDLSLGTIQQHFNKIKFAGLSIKTKTIKCGKHGAIQKTSKRPLTKYIAIFLKFFSHLNLKIVEKH